MNSMGYTAPPAKTITKRGRFAVFEPQRPLLQQTKQRTHGRKASKEGKRIERTAANLRENLEIKRTYGNYSAHDETKDSSSQDFS